MARLTRRELLAWLAAGTATTAAGWSLLPDGGGATAGPPSDPDQSPPPPTDGGTLPPATDDGRPGRSVTDPARDTVSTAGERLLVVVEMPGGNDGLSMIVPHGARGYYDARPQLAIPEGDVIGIDDVIGFHPNLTRIASRGAAAVVGVGSHEPDGSHFEMMQRWWSGDPRPSTSIGTGWLGRIADVIDDPDALATAISIGTGSHPILRSQKAPTLAIPGADAAWYLAGGDEPLEMAFQRGVGGFGALAGDGYGGRIAATTGRTVELAAQLVSGNEEEVEGYPDSDLTRSLRFARQLLSLDAGVRVVHVVMNGDFDTHEAHNDRHPYLMQTLDEAVDAFWGDVERSGMSGRVLLATASEFGRTVYENGSLGLDHGTASSMLVMGPVAAGRVGEHPSLTDLDDNRDLIATAGLDEYLAALTETWLGIPASEVFPTAPTPLALTFG